MKISKYSVKMCSSYFAREYLELIIFMPIPISTNLF